MNDARVQTYTYESEEIVVHGETFNRGQFAPAAFSALHALITVMNAEATADRPGWQVAESVREIIAETLRTANMKTEHTEG